MLDGLCTQVFMRGVHPHNLCDTVFLLSQKSQKSFWKYLMKKSVLASCLILVWYAHYICNRDKEECIPPCMKSCSLNFFPSFQTLYPDCAVQAGIQCWFTVKTSARCSEWDCQTLQLKRNFYNIVVNFVGVTLQCWIRQDKKDLMAF